MKQRSTTPRSTGIVTRSALVASAVVVGLGTPTLFSQQASADRFDDQINALRAEISGYQSQAAVLSQQARTLETELANLAAQKATIQTQIELSQAKYDKLVHEIAENEKRILQNQEALGEIIADMYVDDSISPLEMLASSKNIGDYVDKQEYRESIRSTLVTTIDTIKTLKKQLEEQRQEVEHVLSDQKNQREALAAKEAEQATLLADTQGQEAAYQSLMSDRDSQINSLRAQQAAELAARAQSAGGGRGYIESTDGSNGGYPSMWANAPMNSFVDSWGMYSRQCVSYAAFKVNQAYGNMPYWGGVGNANQWPGNARAAGIPTGRTPKPGAVGVVSSGYYGHVGWVESVNPNGTINISHYNVGWNGNYAVWTNLDPSFFDTYIYFGER